jgi:hypothetical protein
MPIGWTMEAHPRVVGLLQRFPPESNACADLARNLKPIADEHDPDVIPILMTPKMGWFVSPKINVGQRWNHHVLLVLMGHCLDALTGVDGTLRNSYLEAHWNYPDQYIIERADLLDETL